MERMDSAKEYATDIMAHTDDTAPFTPSVPRDRSPFPEHHEGTRAEAPVTIGTRRSRSPPLVDNRRGIHIGLARLMWESDLRDLTAESDTKVVVSRKERPWTGCEWELLCDLIYASGARPELFDDLPYPLECLETDEDKFVLIHHIEEKRERISMELNMLNIDHSLAGIPPSIHASHRHDTKDHDKPCTFECDRLFSFGHVYSKPRSVAVIPMYDILRDPIVALFIETHTASTPSEADETDTYPPDKDGTSYKWLMYWRKSVGICPCLCYYAFCHYGDKCLEALCVVMSSCIREAEEYGITIHMRDNQ